MGVSAGLTGGGGVYGAVGVSAGLTGTHHQPASGEGVEEEGSMVQWECQLT